MCLVIKAFKGRKQLLTFEQFINTKQFINAGFYHFKSFYVYNGAIFRYLSDISSDSHNYIYIHG